MLRLFGEAAPQPSLLLGLLVALGTGLLVGLERERRKGRGPQREAAGVRSFAVVSVLGALAQGLAQPGLVAGGLLAVAVLAALAYWRQSARDPGLTTEAALLLSYLIGALAIPHPELAAGAGVALTMLLAARQRLHRFATRLLSEQELHDGLLLAALALIVLPLMPREPQPWLAGLKPHTLLGLVMLLLALQAAGHVALRLLGERAGLALGGFFSGLVSSTATVAAMGSRYRDQPGLLAGCAGAAVMSTAATWVQALVLVASLSPASVPSVAPACVLGALVAGVAAFALTRTAGQDTGRDHAWGRHNGGPLRLREALIVAVLLTGVAAVAGWAQQRFGSGGLLISVAIAALADSHAPIASLAALAARATIDHQTLLQGLLLAIACNSLVRISVAGLSGGRPYLLRVGGALGLQLAAVALLALVILPPVR